jgi:hypothetical protein
MTESFIYAYKSKGKVKGILEDRVGRKTKPVPPMSAELWCRKMPIFIAVSTGYPIINCPK